MRNDELSADIDCLFNPEADPNDSPREFPDDRLRTEYGLKFDFMMGFDWEGSTMHPHTRICPAGNPEIGAVISNADVPLRLFEAGLRLYATSLLTYSEMTETNTPLRFYPPVILTFWSAFEAFVRHTSEMMLLTCRDIPEAISHFLRETIPSVNKRGDVEHSSRFQPILDRYAVMLRYGFGLNIDRGCRHWQRLSEAKNIRDYYTHVNASGSRSVSDAEVLDFIEAVLLGLIWPSAEAKSTLLIGVHHLYSVWRGLKELTVENLAGGHVEEPFFHNWPWSDRRYQFYCPFVNVDALRFPNDQEEAKHS